MTNDGCGPEGRTSAYLNGPVEQGKTCHIGTRSVGQCEARGHLPCPRRSHIPSTLLTRNVHDDHTDAGTWTPGMCWCERDVDSMAFRWAEDAAAAGVSSIECGITRH